MATATAAQLAVIRSWRGSKIGTDASPWDEADIDARLDRLDGDAHLVALEISGELYANLLENPAEWSFEGDSREKWDANLAHLRAQIAALEKITGTGSAAVEAQSEITAVQLSRDDRGR